MNIRTIAMRGAIAVAVSSVALGGAAPVAFAQEAETPAVSAQLANIDFEELGSITINKRDLNGETPIDSTGTEQDAPGEPLPGVTFQIQKVDIDLSEVSNWADVAGMTAATAAERGFDSNFAAQTETTGENGAAVFSDLPVGIYLVTETEAPQGVIKGAPFVVSVPFTDADGSAWNYDPIVYPKNTKAEATKEVVDSNKQMGEEIEYTLKTPTPALAEGQEVNKYIITDDYDESKVTPNLEGIALTINGQTIPADAYSVADENGVITITFNNFDLLNANPSSTVETLIPAEVIASGEIKNEGSVTFNNPNVEDGTEDSDIEIPTNEVFSYYGKVDVVKRDETEQDKVLEGAKFEIYRSGDNVCGNDDDVQIFTDQEFITGPEGTLTIDGLHATNIEDNNKIIDSTFCLKETEAPAGYVTPTGEAAWSEFKITATPATDEQGAVIEGATIENASLTIDNRKDNTPQLPMTGGAGVGLLAAFGAAIIAAGAWFARRGSKA